MGLREEGMKIYDHAKKGDYGNYVKEVVYDFDYHGSKVMVRYEGVLNDDERAIIDTALDMGGFVKIADEGGFWVGFHDDTFARGIAKHHSLLSEITGVEYHLGGTSIDADDYDFKIEFMTYILGDEGVRDRAWVEDYFPPKLIVKPDGKLQLFFALDTGGIEDTHRFFELNKKYKERGLRFALGEITPVDLYMDNYTPIDEPIEYVAMWIEGENYRDLRIKSQMAVEAMLGIELGQTDAHMHSEADAEFLMRGMNKEMKKMGIFKDGRVAVAYDGIDWVAKVEIDKRKITPMLYTELKRAFNYAKHVHADWSGNTIKIEGRGKSLYGALQNLNSTGFDIVKEKVRIVGVAQGITANSNIVNDAYDMGVFDRLEQMGWEKQEGKYVVSFQSKIGDSKVKIVFPKAGSGVLVGIIDKKGRRETIISPAKMEVHGHNVGSGNNGVSRVEIGNAYEMIEIEQEWKVLKDGRIVATAERVHDYFPFHENGIEGEFESMGKFDLRVDYPVPKVEAKIERKKIEKGVSL